MDAYLVYENSNSWWRKLLKSEYEHVAIVILTEHNYIVLNPRGAGVDVVIQGRDVADPIEKRLYGLYNAVQKVSIPVLTGEQMPVGFFTCVEFVKRVLGIRSMRIQTPWQLYKHIQKEDKKWT